MFFDSFKYVDFPLNFAVICSCLSGNFKFNNFIIFSNLHQQKSERSPPTEPNPESAVTECDAFIGGTKECWICYDADKPEPLIQPCACTGDVSSVHHECLKRWLIESSSAASTSNSDLLRCKVCNCPYDVRSSARLDWERGFTAHHWGSTAVIVTCLCVAVAVAWIIIQLFEDSYIRMLSASVALLVIYICIK